MKTLDTSITEKDIQINFFEKFNLSKEIILSDNNDGVYNGNILEFKTKINNLHSTLFQVIKYLSRLRIKGKNIPKNILLIDDEKVYYYNSNDFINEIEKVYIGPASKNNNEFSTKNNPIVFEYKTKPQNISQIAELLNQNEFTKINIDENCVVGWAERFYKENPILNKNKNAKELLFNELRNPHCFKQFINPWKGQESDFKFIMDCLNNSFLQKELGAFYTPIEYAKLSASLINEAIKEIEKIGNDYVIIDRCGGTGNLESVLTDEQLKHTIISTKELKEWVVLNYRLGEKVKLIIPPTNDSINGLMRGGDALTQDVFEEIKEYINNPKINIILLENPPYVEQGGANSSKKEETKGLYNWKGSFVDNKIKEFIKEHNKHNKNNKIIPNASADIGNLFIWSGFKYYLTKPNDSYILFSKIKYWKSQNLVNYEFKKGYLLNRLHFHATKSAVSLIWWKNNVTTINNIELQPVDIDSETRELIFIDTKKEVKKISTILSKLYDKTKYNDDVNSMTLFNKNLIVGTDGYLLKEGETKKNEFVAVHNDNIIGYLKSESNNIDFKSTGLYRFALYHGHGFYLRKENYFKKLPLWVASQYKHADWTEMEVLCKCCDLGNIFEKDVMFLTKSLIFTCLSVNNKMISQEYKNIVFNNELCFDEGTLATNKINELKLDNDDLELINDFKEILNVIKNDDEIKEKYNKKYTYGLYQIDLEINEKFKIKDKYGKEVVNYTFPILNTKIENLKRKIINYYNKHLKPKLFKYELIK